MQPNREETVNKELTVKTALSDRIASVAKKNRDVYEEAIADFRNSFTLGHEKFEADDSDRS